MIWESKHSVIANVDRSSAWAWHSNVGNWSRFEGNAVESITLDGPFQAGTRITTKMAGQEPHSATLIVVEPPCHTLIEMQLADAVLSFDWTFDELADNRTRVTQHVMLEGPNGSAYVPLMEQHFAPNMEKGMERIAERMANMRHDDRGEI
jgi:polyketide cyclase/dehydrase/lipid transport protein